jgi:cell division protein FtsW (lipid II flippase)
VLAFRILLIVAGLVSLLLGAAWIKSEIIDEPYAQAWWPAALWIGTGLAMVLIASRRLPPREVWIGIGLLVASLALLAVVLYGASQLR